MLLALASGAGTYGGASRSGRYCLFGLNQIIDFGTLFSTTKCFGSKKIARVSHKEFNSLWFDEAKKKSVIFWVAEVFRVKTPS